ncbi:hypothetical protein [Cupriavidus sp. DL-D2]|uniref:putative quinol monooxygenase n=1 Tax=Cupriavidus sp. DL-D2 TaxID=3144974 RepID=UPI0032157020
MTFQDQPSYIIRMRARPGAGDKLFELATAGMVKSGASDRFIILREDGDPDVLWNIEVFRSEAAKSDYETARSPMNSATKSWRYLPNRRCAWRRIRTRWRLSESIVNADYPFKKPPYIAIN